MGWGGIGRDGVGWGGVGWGGMGWDGVGWGGVGWGGAGYICSTSYASNAGDAWDGMGKRGRTYIRNKVQVSSNAPRIERPRAATRCARQSCFTHNILVPAFCFVARVFFYIYPLNTYITRTPTLPLLTSVNPQCGVDGNCCCLTSNQDTCFVF